MIDYAKINTSEKPAALQIIYGCILFYLFVAVVIGLFFLWSVPSD